MAPRPAGSASNAARRLRGWSGRWIWMFAALKFVGSCSSRGIRCIYVPLYDQRGSGILDAAVLIKGHFEAAPDQQRQLVRAPRGSPSPASQSSAGPGPRRPSSTTTRPRDATEDHDNPPPPSLASKGVRIWSGSLVFLSPSQHPLPPDWKPQSRCGPISIATY